MKTPSFLINPVSASLFWGFIGGLSLIAVTFYTNNGPVQALPYPIILIAAILFLKFNDTSDKTFKKMLLTGFFISMIMFGMLSIYVQAFIDTKFGFSLTGQLFRLAVMLPIAFLSSLLISIIAKPVSVKTSNG